MEEGLPGVPPPTAGVSLPHQYPVSKPVKRPIVILAALAVVAVVVVGVAQSGGGRSDRRATLAPSDFRRQATTRLAGSPPALAALHRDANRLFAGRALKTRLAALRGHPVVLNVWGSWCVPCREEFGVFQQASLRLGRGVAFLGLDTQDSREAAARFLAQVPVAYPSYSDFDGSLAKRLGLIGTPTTLFYDARGRLRQLHQGPYRRLADLEADIRRYTSGA